MSKTGFDLTNPGRAVKAAYLPIGLILAELHHASITLQIRKALAAAIAKIITLFGIIEGKI